MITFGIVTDGKSHENVERMIASIEDQLIPQYEIIIVGNANIDRPFTRVIAFDETQTAKGWITKKKNIITALAQYNVIVYAHDYFFFPEGWYEGWVKVGFDFEVAINRVYSMEGPRHSDWLVLAYDMWELLPETNDNWDVALPYDLRGANALQYISGGYFLAKRAFMTKHPLDESLQWGDAEDVEWSKRVRDVTEFQFNQWSYVQLMKPNKWKPGVIKPEYLERMAKIKKLKLYNA